MEFVDNEEEFRAKRRLFEIHEYPSATQSYQPTKNHLSQLGLWRDKARFHGSRGIFVFSLDVYALTLDPRVLDPRVPEVRKD